MREQQGGGRGRTVGRGLPLPWEEERPLLSPRRSFLCVRGRPLARTPPRRFSRVLSARNGNAGALTFCDDGGRSTGRRCRNAGDRGSQRMSRQAPARDRRSQRAGPFSESMERREQRTPPPPIQSRPFSPSVAHSMRKHACTLQPAPEPKFRRMAWGAGE